MDLKPQEFDRISTLTLQHHNQRAGIFFESAGFVELARYYRPPGSLREQQPWLAGV